MSLERTRKSIARLEGMKNITTAQMLDAITRFVRETFVHNGVGHISQMDQGSREELIICAYALSEMLLSVTGQNQETINGQDDAAELQAVFSQMNQLHADLAEKKREIKTLQNQKTVLSVQKKELERQKDAGRKIEKECKSLEEDIKKLKETALPGIEKKRDELEAELEKCNRHYAEVKHQADVYSKKITQELETAQNAEKEKAKKKLEYSRLLEQNKDLEKAVQDYENKKKEYEAWVRECKARRVQMFQNSEEYAARCFQIYTAVNSIFNEGYIKEHLYCQAKKGMIPAADDYPDFALFPDQIDSLDTFQKWLDTIQGRIEGLLAVYQEELKRMAECTGRMTADI